MAVRKKAENNYWGGPLTSIAPYLTISDARNDENPTPILFP